jgi:cell division protein FtsN
MDLLVGLSADEEPASPLRGPLVAAAAAQDQKTSGQKPGTDPTASPPGANGAADSGTARPMPTGDHAVPASPRVFAVRVGAYLDAAAAQREAALLLNQGYHPQIVSSKQVSEGLTWYSVVLDPGKDPAAIRREAAQFAQEKGQQPDIISWSATPAADAGAPPATRH